MIVRHADDAGRCSATGDFLLKGNVFFEIRCLQCRVEGTGVICDGPAGDVCHLHWPTLGGLSTPNTPDGVAYYLEQAIRCELAGANSAAVAMYRAALDHLMFGFGYHAGTLGPKLAQLEKDMHAGKAKWATELNRDYLDVITKLGNGAIHPNDGDVMKQSILDKDLLEAVQVTFSEILDVVYERPAKNMARLAELHAATKKLEKPKK